MQRSKKASMKIAEVRVHTKSAKSKDCDCLEKIVKALERDYRDVHLDNTETLFIPGNPPTFKTIAPSLRFSYSVEGQKRLMKSFVKPMYCQFCGKKLT